MDDFCRKKVDGIRSRAESDIGGVEFICGIIENDFVKYQGVFGGAPLKDIYKEVIKVLNQVQREYLPHLGASQYSSGFPYAEVKLGWAKVVPFEHRGQKMDRGQLVPTDEGIRILEDYRKAQKLVGLEKQAIISQEKIDSMFGR